MRKYYRFITSLFLCSLIFLCTQSSLAQSDQHPEARKKSATFTNEDFGTPPKSADSSASASSQPPSTTTVKESADGAQIQGLEMQFRLLDLALQSAQNPDDRNVRDEIIRIKSQIKDQPFVAVTKADLRDLKFRERYIELKVSIVKAEQEADSASSNIQIQRRKVLKGRRGRNGLQGVRDAQQDAQLEQQDVEVLKAQLTALIEEGRQAGVGPRAFR